MKILMITNGWPPFSLGGVEVYTRRLALELAKSHDVRAFCRESDESRKDYELREFADGPLKVAAVNYNYGDMSGFEGTYFSEPMGEVLGKYLDEKGAPDVAHIHHLGALGHSLVKILTNRGVPVVLTLHDFTLTCPRGQRIRDDFSICGELSVEDCLECLKPQCQGDRSGVEKIYRYLFRRQAGREMLDDFWKSSEVVANMAKLILAPSEYHAKKISKDGFPKEKIRVMPYGYDFRPFEENRRGTIGLARKFGFLGSLIPSKGVHVLIEAFGMLVKGLPDLGLELHLHGPAPAYHGEAKYPGILERMAGDNPVFFDGPYKPDELPGIHKRLDAVVMPSLWWETHGMVVREAKLSGLPVIVSDIGAIGEAFTDGVNGLKFRTGNAKHLRDKMRILATTPGLADKIASNPLKIKTISEDAADHNLIYEQAANI